VAGRRKVHRIRLETEHELGIGRRNEGAVRGTSLACCWLPFSELPLVLCGSLKIVYDVALLLTFHQVKRPEEKRG
jgi:hypothetical protein